MKILIDMNLSPKWVDYFEQNQIFSQHWIQVGEHNAPDEVIFEYAQKNEYIVFTNDLDFGTILAITNTKAPSVFQLKSQDLMPDLIGSMVVDCYYKKC
jgi:predicted nuclease of predicted toxin-antitoxin system